MQTGTTPGSSAGEKCIVQLGTKIKLDILNIIENIKVADKLLEIFSFKASLCRLRFKMTALYLCGHKKRQNNNKQFVIQAFQNFRI